MDRIFSGLENLGFNDLKDVEIYKSDNISEDAPTEKKEIKIQEYLYDKSYACPVCGNNFKEKTVKIGKARLISKDTDLMPKYENINPLFYDVVICPRCGYSALIRYFDKIKQDQADLIRLKISSKFKAKIYPDIYDLDTAIERYKLALLNSVVKNAKNSEKAYICLKTAWLYRLKDSKEDEKKFLEQAFIGFKEAYEKEAFPICGMDKFTLMYLLGELSRRLGDNPEALLWFSKVIVSTNVSPRLKELARDQKDLIKNS
ncbi:hypothetical protein SAMN05443428_106129 [Caloramator quimbayensis]|uniref:DUF2225 domain-containing protein n=1 Tax=Caloramator quimbayensis TaxID=1147123 RepID=A0A1T4X8J5_9CLOT|nr:DUF2225 domain-containing protein [Caloramator quimbayensis]SKA85201.1 hypothetical protein SAMN05443428_106129 [Caloramator quimbayensis]